MEHMPLPSEGSGQSVFTSRALSAWGWRYALELDTDGDPLEAAVDPRQQPEHLAHLLSRLNALLDANGP
jgi:hypothetical protein